MRAASRWLGAALALAGAALAIHDRPRPGPIDDAAARALASAIDGRIRERQAAAAARARTLAELPVVPRAVATDARTVRDLTATEVGFRVAAGERLELGQVDLATGALTSLLRLPATAAPVPGLDRPGARALLDGGALVAIEVVAVAPSERQGEVRGTLAVVEPIDLAGLATVPAALAIGPTTLALGDGAPPTAAASAPLATIAGAVVRAPGRATVIGAGVARGLVLAVAGLALAVIGGRRRRAAPQPVAATPAVVVAPPAPAAADRFGRYQTVELIGTGGMADVWRARATGAAGFERPVALKVLHPQMARRPDAVQYFLDEARLASRLRHPNVVGVLDLGQSGDAYFIAMELIDGADLDSAVRALRAAGGQVPVAVALAIVRKVCDGLHAAHTAVDDDGQPLTIIHRDVKTANVLVSRQGEVKVGDFGIARAATSVRTTTIGETRGTAEFMAPEQRMGHDIDVRADVYAVAAITYELLTGAEINLDLAALVHKGIVGWPHLPAPSTTRADLPPELDGVVLGALAFAPADRPASCAAFEEQLAAIVARHGLVAGDKDIAAWLATAAPPAARISAPLAIGA
ncbi:MAG: serine/threonine protein kinase [Myxococcales bacterium]|nr:serine/threonine protein kinase [Myxococcales bacterium]